LEYAAAPGRELRRADERDGVALGLDPVAFAWPNPPPLLLLTLLRELNTPELMLDVGAGRGAEYMRFDVFGSRRVVPSGAEVVLVTEGAGSINTSRRRVK
jgi:hypothetical protein